MVYINIFTVADPDLQIKGREGGRGGSHPDPEINGGGVSKKFFSVLRASVWSKNKITSKIYYTHR